ncbi:hypothetical protein D9M68_541690 [compost metagenome]
MQAQLGQRLSDAVLGADADGHGEGVVDFPRQQVVAFTEHHGHGGQAKGRREALRVFAQGQFGARARLQVQVGEQHAGLAVHVDRLPGRDHGVVAAVRPFHHAFALRDGLPLVEPGDRISLVLAAAQQVEFTGRLSQHRFARAARHVQKALVHFHAAQVLQSADHGGNGIAAKVGVEVRFGAGLAGLVVQDQHAVVRAVAVSQVQATHAHVPQEFPIVLAPQVQLQVVERFGRRQTVQRILAGGHAVMAAAGEGVALAVAGWRAAQVFEPVGAMEAESAGIGPGDGAVGFQQDDAFVQSSDDALQMLAVRMVGVGVRGHVVLFISLGTNAKNEGTLFRCPDSEMDESEGRGGSHPSAASRPAMAR